MKNLFYFVLQWLRLKAPETQTTQEERACLSRYAKSRKKLVEVGVFQGVTTRVLREAMHPDGVLFGIDPFFKNRLGVCFYRLIAFRNVDEVKKGHVKWLEMTSLEALRGPILREGKDLDFVFIDGDHSWEGIDADWKGVKDLIVPGGIVALHDSRNCGGCGSEQYTQQVILKDSQYQVIDTVDSLTVLSRHS
jgi:predicted O-methyltransferase YrrM